MLRLLAIAVLLAVTTPLATQGQLIAKGAALTEDGWTHERRIDFDVYYSASKDDSERLGCYIGGHPSFKPTRSDPKTFKSQFLKHTVEWQFSKPKGIFRADMIYQPKGDPYTKYHAWVEAPTSERREYLVQNLSKLTFARKQ
jgi:hypothetical protein